MFALWTQHLLGPDWSKSYPITAFAAPLQKKTMLISTEPSAWILRGIFNTFEQAKAELNKINETDWEDYLKEWMSN